MDGNDKTLTINILNENSKKKKFVYSKKEFEIDEIKNLCIKNFKYQEKDKDKITLYFVDEEGDKNIINNFDDLLNCTKNIDEKNLSINLYCELEKNEKKDTINDPNKNNKKNDNKENIMNSAMLNNNNENNIIYLKDKEIEELKNENYNLKKKNEYELERYKNLIFYYEEFIKTTKKEKEKENNNNEKEKEKKENNNNEKEKEKKENNKNEKENILKDNKNENENEIKENNNQINDEFKDNKIDKRYNSVLVLPNKLEKSKTFNYSKIMHDINDDKIQNDKNLINENPIKFKDIEFINEKCRMCKKKSDNKIYKDYKNKNIYLCENCYKNEIKSHYKDDYFEIKFPENVLKLRKERKIRIKALGNKPINDFNNFVNNIFFDKEGNFSTKDINEINDKEFSELKRIYDDMIFINEDPVKYFAEYQVLFINKPKMKLDDNEKNLIDKKLKLFLDNLIKLQK